MISFLGVRQELMSFMDDISTIVGIITRRFMRLFSHFRANAFNFFRNLRCHKLKTFILLK
jgi:AraC-like DNA-binding protein